MTDECGARCEGGSAPCACRAMAHAPRLVVLTGGPGAGKTAVLEMVRRAFCRHDASCCRAHPVLPAEVARASAE